MLKLLLLDDHEERGRGWKSSFDGLEFVEAEIRGDLDRECYESGRWDLAILHWSNKERTSIVDEDWRNPVPRLWFSGALHLKDKPPQIKSNGDEVVHQDRVVEWVQQWARDLGVAEPTPAEIPSPRSRGRHGAANQWGPWALLRSIERLTGGITAGGTAEEEKERAGLEERARQHWGKRHRQLEELGGDGEGAEAVRALRERWADARAGVCASGAAVPGERRILVVDDELEGGWALAYRVLFRCLYGEKVALDLWATPELPAELERLVVEGQHSLALIDMRLAPDQDGPPARMNRTNVDQLSGIRLLGQVKRWDPTLPVVVCTASNKSWMYRAVLEQGADAYWSKDDPDSETEGMGGLENAVALVEEIAEVVQWAARSREVVRNTHRLTAALGKRIEGFQMGRKGRSAVLRTLKQRDATVRELLRRPRLGEPRARLNQDEPISDSQFETAFLYIWSIRNEWIWNIVGQQSKQDRSYRFRMRPHQLVARQAPPPDYRWSFSKEFRAKWAEARERRPNASGELAKAMDRVAPDGMTNSEFEKFVFVYQLLMLDPTRAEEWWVCCVRARRRRNRLTAVHGVGAESGPGETVREDALAFIEVLTRLARG